MAEITLGNYTAYVFQEMVKAREMADEYSRAVAERYAADPVLRYFPAPRFRVPKLTLSIPVLISDARYTQTVRFDFPEREFVAFIAARADGVQAAVEESRGGPIRRSSVVERESAGVERLAHVFHRQLTKNPDPQQPEPIVSAMWKKVFSTCLREARLFTFYEESDPEHLLLERTTAEVLDKVRERTVVDRTGIESLLVNPETNVVKNGSTDATLFTVNAELVEEGVYLRSVRDEQTQEVRTIVEFD